MKIKPKVLADALASVKPATSTRSAIQALAGVRVQAGDRDATLEATDMEIAVEKQLDVIDIGQPLDAIVTHADLAKAAKAFGKREEIEMSNDIVWSDSDQAERNKLREGFRDAHGLPHGHRVTAYLRHAEKIADRGREELTVTDGKRTIRLPGLRREDWPEIDWNPAGETVVIESNGANLAQQLHRACTVASKDDTRPILTGVCIDPRTGPPMLVGTDSYRLVALRIPGDVRPLEQAGADDILVNQYMTVPARALKLAAKAMPKSTVTISHAPFKRDAMPKTLGDSAAGFAFIDLPDVGECWRSRLIEGQFPNYRQLIPDAYDLEVKVSRAALEEAASVAVTFTRGNAPTRLSVNGHVKLHGYSPDGPSYEEEIDDVEYKVVGAPDMPFEIGFNPEFLRDVAKTAASDTLTLDLISPLRPGRFRDGDDIHLLMPIRLNV